MEQFLKMLLKATQESLQKVDIITRITGYELSDEEQQVKANQQKLIVDIENALTKMMRCRPKIDPWYFAAMCVISTDETLDGTKRAIITATVMKLYGVLTNQSHKEAWNDIVKAAEEAHIPIDNGVKTVIDKTIAKLGGRPDFSEFL